MVTRYTNLRKDRVYAEGKEKVADLSVFKTLSKLLFLFSMFFTASTYWWSVKVGQWHQSFIVANLGLILVICGVWKLGKAFKDLGKNYSPLFDAFMPNDLVNTGAYQKIRHPIYTYNLYVSFGLALSSGSYFVLLSALIGAAFVIRSMFLEEAYLLENFEAYQNYKKNSYRMIPYIF